MMIRENVGRLPDRQTLAKRTQRDKTMVNLENLSGCGKAGTVIAGTPVYLIRIITSSELQPIVRQIASTRSRDVAMIVISERVGLCNTIQARILRSP